MQENRRRVFDAAELVVVKVGSYVLTRGKGTLNIAQFQSLASQIQGLYDKDKRVILVSSGAIAAGSPKLGLERPLKTLSEQQAAAAVGQSKLMATYEQAFAEFQRPVAQLLLTHEDLADKKRYANVRRTLEVLMRSGVLPIINENDTVATEEIKFGDNDVLASSIAILTSADLMVLMTDVDGLYDKDPKKNSDARRISVIESPSQMPKVTLSGPGLVGKGGMESKIRCAMNCATAGVNAAIVDGIQPQCLIRLVSGEDVGTLVLARPKKLKGKRRWVGHGAKGRGALVLDDGALLAILSGKKSLLPSGILHVEGEFCAGSVVYCADKSGKRIAKGISAYGSEEILLIKGKRSNEIEGILGHKGYEEVIHRDDLVVG